MAQHKVFSDAEFQRESDARALAEADVIRGDKKRMAGAKKAAKSMAGEKMKEARAMKKVATGKVNKARFDEALRIAKSDKNGGSRARKSR